MKKLVGLVVVLAVLVLGGYYGTGVVTEKSLKKNIDLLNRADGLYVDLQDYNRGWFKSTAQFKWRFYSPERVVKGQDGQLTTVPAQDVTFDMPVTIYHGPVIFSAQGVKFGLGYAYTDLTVPAQYMNKFSEMFTDGSTKPQVHMSVMVNYLNRSHLRFDVPEFKLTMKEGGSQFHWVGLTSSINSTFDLDTISGETTLKGFEFTQGEKHATLTDLAINFSLDKDDDGLYVGNAELAFPSFTIQESGKTLFEVTQYKIATDSQIHTGLFDTSFQSSVSKILAQDKSYGPGKVVIALKNLDASALATINNDLNQVKQGSVSAQQQALVALLPQLPKLFSQGAQFEVSELQFALPEGQISGNLLVTLPKEDVSNPFQLIQKITGQGRLQVPVSVVKTLAIETAKQQLAQQSKLAKSIAEQAEAADSVPPIEGAATDPSQGKTDKQDATSAVSAPGTNALPADAAQSPALSSDASQEAQATAQAEEKLNALAQAGLLSLQGSNYVIAVQIENGQLTVNGHPFNPAMFQF